MSARGCLDRVDCQCCNCDCWESLKDKLVPKRNMLSSILSGTLFSLAWWVMIDAFVEHSRPVYAAYVICGILSTIALLMINAISTGQVTGDAYTEGCMGKKGARAWLFVGFVLAFAGLIGSLWIFIQEFLVPAVTCVPTSILPSNGTNFTITTSELPTNSTIPTMEPCVAHWWQGAAVFVQNILIFLSTLVFKFGRTEEDTW